MGQQEFLQTIRACRRRLDLAGFLKKAVFGLSVGAAAGILFQAAAVFIPFYHAGLYTVLSLFFALMAAALAAFVRRPSMLQAALTIDSFGMEERVVTAYEHLGEDGMFIRLQREDAIRHLHAHRDQIKISLWPGRRQSVLLFGLCAALLVLVLIPSAAKEQAKELRAVREEARERADEIEEVIGALQELEELEQEALTPEQQEALQEMVESLESSLSEYQRADSIAALEVAGEKLAHRYAGLSSQLSALAQSLSDGAQASVMTAESMQAMADKLQQMSGQGAPDGSGTSSGQQGSDGSDGNGQGSGNGDGQGQGNGNGQGNGQGQGNSQGSGNGDGNGGGRGTGSSDTPHDHVSVPNAVVDSGNLTGTAASHDTSQFFRAQNGLSWEGQHVPYESVIKSYEQNAYEGIAAGRYPSGMEDVIKEYFSSFGD